MSSPASRLADSARRGPGPMGGPPGGPPGMGHKEKPKNAKATTLRVLAYLKQDKLGLALVLCAVVLGTAASLAASYRIRPIINDFAAALSRFKAIGRADFSDAAVAARLLDAGWSLCLLIAFYALSALAVWFQSARMTRISQAMVRRMRQDLFERMQSLRLSFFDGTTHGDLMSRLTNDVENISNTINTGVTQLFSSVITVVGTLTLMVFINWRLTIISLVTIPLVALSTRFIAAHTRKYFKNQQDELGRLNGVIEETISGHVVVTAFGREAQALADFDRHNAAYYRQALKAQFFGRIIGPVSNMFGNLNYAVTAAAGGWLALTRGFDLGGIATFLTYSQQFSRPINEIANLSNMVMSAIAGAERMFEIMDEPSEYLEDGTEAFPRRASGKGRVELSHVDFAYRAGQPVLRDVSLVAEPGQTVALVGPTGAGKTTIVNLLTRFYEIDSGLIAIDGVDIRRIKKDELRREVAIVLQDTHLFSASVRENIRFGRLDAGDAEVERVAALANADFFIRHLPEGYDTQLAEDASNISQGQRQLLAIARAMLADPSILILDEATSSIDTRTEVHIQKAMRELMKGRTSFVIAHRLSTIRDADLIAVIESGRIVERGSHAELLRAGGLYSRLCRIQEEGKEI
jgi:ATP-binding cassette, subfamily B, multidrug efflux pump